MSGKSKKNGIMAKVKRSTPTQEIDEVTGDEERERKLRTKETVGVQPSYPGPFSCLL